MWLEDCHLVRHNRRTDIQLSDTFSYNREETGEKKGSQSESVDRQLTDVIWPSSRLGRLEKARRGYMYVVLAFIRRNGAIVI